MAWNQFFHGWGEDDDLLASKNFIPLRFVPSPLFVPMNNSSLKNFEHVPLRMLNPYISFVLLTKTCVLFWPWRFLTIFYVAYVRKLGKQIGNLMIVTIRFVLCQYYSRSCYALVFNFPFVSRVYK